MRNETDVQDAIDALLRGASLEALARQYTLTPEEWENVIVAQELTSIQVAPRSQIRAELKEYLMVTAEQERFLGEQYREEPVQEDKPRKKKRRRWPFLIVAVFAVVGGLALLAAVGFGLVSIFTVRRAPPAPEPVRVYEQGDYIEEFGRNMDNVYLVQQTPDATFGGIFTLQNMIVIDNPSDEGSSIILMWQVNEALNNQQYSVVVTRLTPEEYQTVEPGGLIRSISIADLSFPLDVGAIIATQHQSFDYRYESETAPYTIEIIDRLTEENLLLADGAERLTLRLQPAVTIPAQLVPEEGAPTPTSLPPTAAP